MAEKQLDYPGSSSLFLGKRIDIPQRWVRRFRMSIGLPGCLIENCLPIPPGPADVVFLFEPCTVTTDLRIGYVRHQRRRSKAPSRFRMPNEAPYLAKALRGTRTMGEVILKDAILDPLQLAVVGHVIESLPEPCLFRLALQVQCGYHLSCRYLPASGTEALQGAAHHIHCYGDTFHIRPSSTFWRTAPYQGCPQSP